MPLNTSTQAVGVSGPTLNCAFPLLKAAFACHSQALLAAPAAGPHACNASCMVMLPERSAGSHFGREFGLNWMSSSKRSCIRLITVVPV